MCRCAATVSLACTHVSLQLHVGCWARSHVSHAFTSPAQHPHHTCHRQTHRCMLPSPCQHRQHSIQTDLAERPASQTLSSAKRRSSLVLTKSSGEHVNATFYFVFKGRDVYEIFKDIHTIRTRSIGFGSYRKGAWRKEVTKLL